MRTKTRDAARQTPAARRSTKQPPLKRRRAASDAPAAGTAEDPIKANSSSEYDDESYGEFLEPEPAPRKRGRSSADDAPPKKRRKKKSEAYDSNGIVYAWDKLDLDIKQYEREALDALDQKTAALCREPRGGATYVLLTDEGPIPVCAPPEYLEALYSISDKIGRDVEALVHSVSNQISCARRRRRDVTVAGQKLRARPVAVPHHVAPSAPGDARVPPHVLRPGVQQPPSRWHDELQQQERGHGHGPGLYLGEMQETRQDRG